MADTEKTEEQPAANAENPAEQPENKPEENKNPAESFEEVKKEGEKPEENAQPRPEENQENEKKEGEEGEKKEEGEVKEGEVKEGEGNEGEEGEEKKEEEKKENVIVVEEEESESPSEKRDREEEERLEKELLNEKKKFSKASVEDIQREIGEMTKKIEHEKINLRICTERYNKKYRQYCELQGKPVAQSEEEKEKEKKEKALEKKNHKVSDPIKRKQGKDKILAEEQEKSRKALAKNTTACQDLSSEINDLVLANESLKKDIENLRKQKNEFIKQRENLKASNKRKEKEIVNQNKKNEVNKSKIKTKELQTSVDTGAKNVKRFERSRDELEKEYHRIIEEFIKRQREEKKEAAKKRQMAVMTSSGSKGGFKGKNDQELEKQIKALKDEEISDRTPIIEEVVEKWKYINKFKKHMIEKYAQNSNIIHEAFERMMKFLGLENMEELPIVFKKNEDQMSNIKIYISQLENENNELKDNKKIIEEKIVFLKNKYAENSDDKEKFIKEQIEKIDSLKEKIAELEEDLEHKREIFKKIQPVTDEYLTKLNQSILAEYIINKNQIDPNLQYNEQSVNKFMSNVEDYYKLIQMFDESVNNPKKEDNKEIDKLRDEIRNKLENFEKTKVMNKNLYKSMRTDANSGIDYDEIIKRSTDMIMKSMGNNYMTTLSKKEQEALNATLNKTNGSQNSNMSRSQKSGGASKVEEKKIADAELI
jgi:hypothetical protein